MPYNNNSFSDALPVNTHMYFISRDNLRDLWKELGGLIYCFIEDELGYTDLSTPVRPSGVYKRKQTDDSFDIDICRAHEAAWLRTPVVDNFGDVS